MASAQAASLSLWHILQALGDLNLSVAAGVGGSMEWSLRCMPAKLVMGMWQEMHWLPGVPALWRLWAAASFTRSA